MPSNFVDLWTYFLHYLRRNHTLLTQDELRINFERAMKDVAEKGTHLASSSKVGLKCCDL